MAIFYGNSNSASAVLTAGRLCWVRSDASDSPLPEGCTNRLLLTGIKCDTEFLSHTPDPIITLERWGNGCGFSFSLSSSGEQDAHRVTDGEIQKLSHWRAFSSRYTQGADLAAGACHFPVFLLLHPIVWKCGSRGADHQCRFFTRRHAVSAEDSHLRVDSQTGFPQQPAQHGWITSAEHGRDSSTGSLRSSHVHLLGCCAYRPTPCPVLLLSTRLSSPPHQRSH